MIRYEKDIDNIVTLTLDMQGRKENILNHEITAALEPVLEHLKKEKARRALKGVVITSNKKTFLAGGDLEYLYQCQDPKEMFEYTEKINRFLRDLERPGVPVVAAINGSALGMGFELALACHHRIVLNRPDIKLGFPEIKVGLIPGNGGIIRLMWLLGIRRAFPILEKGHRYLPLEALEVGMVDELAENKREMIEKAKAWLKSESEGRRKWDTEYGTIPGGTAREMRVAMEISRLSAQVAARYRGNYPAPQAILNILSEASKVDFDTATRIESRYYSDLLCRPESKNMIKTFWMEYRQIKSGINRPKGFGKFRPRTVGIIGAGMMGSGIAFVCLMNGIRVVMKDVSKLIAERARDYVRSRFKELVADGRLTQPEMDRLLKRIVTTDVSSDFKDCDLVLEAVFENHNVKVKVLKEAEEFMDEYSLFASNTVSIPITKLAQSSFRPENYVGLHFFHPVASIPLVEVIRGEQTSDETIARAFDFVRAIQKTPIIVKDSWGFFAARVQNTYILEGITLLNEGYPPGLVENLGAQIGMPKGALRLADELSLKLVLKYERQAAAHYGPKYIQHPAVDVLNHMIDDLDRPSTKTKPGFYDRGPEGEWLLWEGTSDFFPGNKTDFDLKEIEERLLFVQVLEAVWCLHEKVIHLIPEANLGSVFGWGFPAFKGGVIRFIEDYGREDFIARCRELEAKFGPRFKVPGWLKRHPQLS